MSHSGQTGDRTPGTLSGMHEDFERCYRAVGSRDARFDGWFVTAVLTTGIYCRPSCPVPPPQEQNVRFLPTAAAAQHAGFRACKRCRPDATPGSPEWDTRADLVARAMRLIADGVVDRNGVAGLSRRLGYSSRQLERLLTAEVGAGPLALARAQRAQTARTLIETTDLPMAQVAFGAGFSSIRQFNDTVRAVYATSPTELRRHAATNAAGNEAEGNEAAGNEAAGALDLRLPFRAPFAPEGLFGHLAATAVPGCEEVRAGSYRRTLDLPHGPGIVALRPHPDHVSCRLVLSDLRDLPTAVARCRRLLDLDADPVAVDDVLRIDAALEPLVTKAPGRRVPRTVDEAEFAIRAVLGQQVSTAAARTHAARLVATHGSPVSDPEGGLTHLFPSPDVLAGADLSSMAMPASRRRTLVAVVAALADGDLELGAGADRQRARAQLARVEGIGPWTIETIAMRALGDPDAFPASDMGVRRGAEELGLGRSTGDLEARAERWRPWRSYAVQYLWSTQDHAINRWPQEARSA